MVRGKALVFEQDERDVILSNNGNIGRLFCSFQWFELDIGNKCTKRTMESKPGKCLTSNSYEKSN